MKRNGLEKAKERMNAGTRGSGGAWEKLPANARRALAAVALAGTVCAGANAMGAAEFDRALREALDGADEIAVKNVMLDKRQAEAVETVSRTRLNGRLFSFYVGKKDGKVVGAAAIGSHTVRTKKETFLVSISPSGKIRRVEILAFLEPPEYMAPERWLKLLGGKGLKDGLKPKKDLPNITGATLTARALSDGVRQVLAVYEVLDGESWGRGDGGN